MAPGQTAFGVNLDGVALIAGGAPDTQSFSQLSPRCTAALISDRHLLSAAHCYDDDEDGQPDDTFTNSPQVAAFELADRVEILRIDTNRIQFPLSSRPSRLTWSS